MSSLHIYHSPELLLSFPVLYGGILPSHEAAWYFTLAGFAGTLLLILGEMFLGKRLSLSFSAMFLLVTVFGSYGYYSYYSDEVSINLRHSLNLHNCGHFSFDCSTQVDGTVELLYYALISPFAVDPVSAVRANYALGAILFALTVFSPLLTRLYQLRSLQGRLSVALLAMTPCLSATYGSGFGNLAVVTGFSYALCYFLANKPNRAFVISSLLPILRPDAACYSLILLMFGCLWSRKAHLKYFVLLGLSIVGYFACFSYLYGKLIPTPIALKSAGVDLFNLFSLLLTISSFISSYQFLTLFAIGTASLTLYYANNRHIPEQQQLKVFALVGMVVSLIVIRCLYASSHSGIVTMNFRYWAPLEVVVILLLTYFPWNKINISRNLKQAASVTYLLLLASPLAIPPRQLNHPMVRLLGAQFRFFGDHTRIPFLLSIGHFLDELVPEHWKIATSEMASFALGIPSRPIIDLWGYTNPEIANSPFCHLTVSTPRLKMSVNYVTKTSPDILFFRFSDKNAVLSFVPDSTQVEEIVTRETNAGHGSLQAGSMEWQLEHYDLFWIADDAGMVILLHVKKTRARSLINILEGRGFEKILSRPLDSKRMTEEFNLKADQEKIVICKTGTKISFSQLVQMSSDMSYYERSE